MSSAPAQPSPRPSGSQPLPALHLEIWGATDKGRQREGNEDSLYPHSGSDTFPYQPRADQLLHKGQLLVVADGVGGARAGAEASRWIIRVAVERYYDEVGIDIGANLRAAIETANNSLHQYLQSTNARDAGSTMTAAVIHGNRLYVANVGDSRIYLLRNGQLFQQTRDHTLTQQKLDQKIITPEQAKTDPDHNVLVRSMGARSTVHVDLFPALELAAGDVVLLCSDGLSDMVDDPTIARILQAHSPKQAAQRLIAEANRRGGRDNISVVIAQVGKRPTAAATGGLGGLFDAVDRMPQGQKIVLLIGAILLALLALALCVTLAWSILSGLNSTPTPAPSATPPPTVAGATPTTAVTQPPPTPEETTPVAGQPTSTLVPTFTPTNTPRPPTPIPTNTPLPTPTDTPPPPPDTDPGDTNGGESPPQPTTPPEN